MKQLNNYSTAHQFKSERRFPLGGYSEDVKVLLSHLCCRDHWERLDRRSNLWHNLRNLRLGIDNPPIKTTVCISDMRVE